MRRISWFGIFLIIVGLLLLFSEFNIVKFSWRELIKFWPLIFIFWGLDLLIGEKKWVNWLFALIVIFLVIFLIFFSSYLGPFFRGRDYRFYKEWNYPYKEDIKSLGLEVFVDVGDISLTPLNSDENLLLMSSDAGVYIYAVDKKNNGRIDLDLEIKSEDNDFWIFRGRHGGKVDLKVNSKVELDLSFNLGVGDVSLDVRNFKLKNLKVKGGVGNTKIYLPKISCYVEVTGGIGNINMYIPENVVLDLVAEKGIGNISVDREIKQGKDGDEKEIIHMRVKSGIGNINIFSEKKQII